MRALLVYLLDFLLFFSIFAGFLGTRFDMGIISTIMGVFGFGFGITVGLVVGYFLFIYYQPTDVKVRLFFFFDANSEINAHI